MYKRQELQRVFLQLDEIVDQLYHEPNGFGTETHDVVLSFLDESLRMLRGAIDEIEHTEYDSKSIPVHE